MQPKKVSIQKNSWISLRQKNTVSTLHSSPLSRLLVTNSKAFNILGTVCLLMTIAVIAAIQPQIGQVNALETTKTTLYHEYKEISIFPQSKQVKAQELSANKLGQYTIAENDTVNSICLSLSTDCEQLKLLNDLTYPYNLKVGNALVYKL
jgi:LysM repeat protein